LAYSSFWTPAKVQEAVLALLELPGLELALVVVLDVVLPQAARPASAAPAARVTAAAVTVKCRIRVVTPCRTPHCAAVLSISAGR